VREVALKLLNIAPQRLRQSDDAINFVAGQGEVFAGCGEQQHIIGSDNNARQSVGITGFSFVRAWIIGALKLFHIFKAIFSAVFWSFCVHFLISGFCVGVLIFVLFDRSSLCSDYAAGGPFQHFDGRPRVASSTRCTKASKGFRRLRNSCRFLLSFAERGDAEDLERHNANPMN
jgi:hypothetical protein